ncbi:MAG: hypothetical protein FWH44_02565 [Methanomassiliicoccaceae archaeon]|nr:hypothetical protein [Methanomassiliicoccaceae archaeon]
MYQIFIAIAIAAKIARDNLKNYLIACEYIQIDPSEAHDITFIERRVRHVLSKWGRGDDPNDVRTLRTVTDRYLSNMRHGHPDGPPPPGFTEHIKYFEPGKGPHAFQTAQFWGREPPENKIGNALALPAPEKFAQNCRKLIEEGKLKILAGTVSEEYVKKELRQDNYDNYVKATKPPDALPMQKWTFDPYPK